MNFCKTKSQIRRLRKMAQITCVVLICAGCQTQSPPVTTLTPMNRHATKDEIQNPYDKIIFIGEKKLTVQIVRTDADMQKGLSGRNKLADNEGMLFDFTNNLSPTLSLKGEGVRPKFWMKDMNFDLDLIWIANKKVVGITSDVPAPKSGADVLPTYAPPQDVDMVLEVNTGWSKGNEIKIGDKIKIE